VEQAASHTHEGADRTHLRAELRPDGQTDGRRYHQTGVATLSGDVDNAFLQALRLMSDAPWSPSAMALLEAIDGIDHLPLTAVLPPELKFLGGQGPRVHHELAVGLGRALSQGAVSGVVDASLVSHTLVLSLHHDRLAAPGFLAGLVGSHGGRMETDEASRGLRLVVPSSTRLIRVVPLRCEDGWIAVPWAHFLAVEGTPEAQEARLLIGDEEERLRVTEVGAATTALRYELGRHLRRRDRYRGVVATAGAEVLRLFG